MADHGQRERSRRTGAQQFLRGAALALVAVVVVLAVVAAAPFAVRERAAHGPVGDTAAALPGQAQRATDGLRALGYACSDVVTGSGLTTRDCSRVRYLTSSSVRMVLSTTTGAVRLAVATTDDEQRAPQGYREVVGVLGTALDLPQQEQAEVSAAAGARAATTTDLGWGSLVVRTAAPSSAEESSATLRAAGSATVGPGRSTTTLDVGVGTLVSHARAHGYTCTTPQVPTSSSCGKVDGGYAEELSFQGTDRRTTEVYLSVTSTSQRRTRSRWVRSMDQVLSWIGTGQSRAVRAWLGASRDAPGAAGYVDGLPVSFLVRTGTYVKETFGSIGADCATSTGDPSSCDDRPATAGRPG